MGRSGRVRYSLIVEVTGICKRRQRCLCDSGVYSCGYNPSGLLASGPLRCAWGPEGLGLCGAVTGRALEGLCAAKGVGALPWEKWAGKKGRKKSSVEVNDGEQ